MTVAGSIVAVAAFSEVSVKFLMVSMATLVCEVLTDSDINWSGETEAGSL